MMRPAKIKDGAVSSDTSCRVLNPLTWLCIYAAKLVNPGLHLEKGRQHNPAANPPQLAARPQ